MKKEKETKTEKKRKPHREGIEKIIRVADLEGNFHLSRKTGSGTERQLEEIREILQTISEDLGSIASSMRTITKLETETWT